MARATRRHRMTSLGKVYLTEAEELEIDAQEATWAAGADDRAAAEHRETRNKLLAETDYFALTDVTMNAAMTTYRQALRDITSHPNWPNLSDEDWPTKP